VTRLCAAVALLLSILLSPPSGAAFELLRVRNDPCTAEQNLFWSGATASVSTVNLPSSLRSLADDARLRWNASLRRFNFFASSVGIGQSVCRRDGVTSMVVSDSSCDGSSLGDALAVTRSIWNADGTLVDADVVFNARSRVVGDEAAFLEVAMHELGHVLGLDHSDACGESGSGTLMRSVLVFGAPRLEAPQADDVAGAEFIYPSAGGPPPAENASSCAITEPGAPSWTLLPWSCIALFAALRFLRYSRLTYSGNCSSKETDEQG
jgi:hypothetical protein